MIRLFPRTSQSRPLSHAELPQQMRDLRFQRPECRGRLRGVGRVAVVGGGFAGLMAARRLVEHGIKVTVYEARKDVGGRVLSNPDFSAGRITEEGAELIGSFHTRWLGLAREFGLAMISRMDRELYEREGLDVQLSLDKFPLSRAEFKDLTKKMEVRILTPLAEKAKKEIQDPSQPWRPEEKFSKELRDYDNMSVQVALPKFCQISERTRNKTDEPLWKMLELQLVNDEVAPLDEMNFLGLLCKVRRGQDKPFGEDRPPMLNGYWDELEIFRCADGCQTLARKITEQIQTPKKKGDPKPAEVKRLRAVTHIDLDCPPKGVCLASKIVRPDGKLEPGPPLVEQFDYVILAIPPSVWADVKITPVHPKESSEVGHMHMNDAVKYFSDVKERFWIKKKAAPIGGALRLGQVWEGTDNQTRVGKQGIVLSVFAGPVSASRRAPTRDDFQKELPLLYPEYPGNLNKRPLFSDWPNVPFIKTGYWSPKRGEIFRVGEKLSKPYHDRLFFAGEHTQMDFFGYMEGALRSGERAAETLMLKACGLLEKSAPKPPSPPLVARATLTRENKAFEPEVGTRLEARSSTDDPGEAESPFLDRNLFAAGVEEEWKPRVAALVAESPFVGTLEERRSKFSSDDPGAAESPFLDRDLFAAGVEEDWEPRVASLAAESPLVVALEESRSSFGEEQWEEEEAPDELEGEEELEAAEVWEELAEDTLAPQADQEETEFFHEGVLSAFEEQSRSEFVPEVHERRTAGPEAEGFFDDAHEYERQDGVALEWEDPGLANEQASFDVEAEWFHSEIWTGSADQIVFRDRVLEAHLALSKKVRGLPQRDLPDDALQRVPKTRIGTLPDTAAAAGRLLAAAEADLAQAQQAGDADALRTIGLSVTSGYRGSKLQRTLWIDYFSAKGGYYDRTHAAREKLPEGPHSDQAVAYMLKPKKYGGFGLGGRIAAPGYSNHQGGIAVDFWQERRKGHYIGNRSDEASRARWRSTWFYAWLKANAATYGFKPIATEEWHWEYRPGGRAAAPSRSATGPASVSAPANERVRFAQRVLNATEGERLGEDGDLGRLTRDGLERFRAKYNLGAGGVLDAKTELALAQRGLEDLAQASMFARAGVRDAATDQALTAFKSARGLGIDATLDAPTRRALADALARRTLASRGSDDAAASDYLGGKLWTFTTKTLGLRVAVFCPKAALSRSEVEVLLFAHGLLGGCPRPKRIPAGFITDAPFDLGRLVDASGRPMVLVVPLLDWAKPGGEQAFGRGRERWHALAKPGNLNAVVAEVLVELGRVRDGVTPSLRGLFLAGHSRAYDFLEPLAYSSADPQMRQGALAKLSQVWSFDATYVGNVTRWKSWLDASPNLRVSVFFRPGNETKPSKTSAVGLAFYREKGGRLAVTPAYEDHCAVPAKRLPELLGAAALAIFPQAGEEAEAGMAVRPGLDLVSPFRSEGPFSPTPEVGSGFAIKAAAPPEAFDALDDAEFDDDELKDDAEESYTDIDPELAEEVEHPDHEMEDEEPSSEMLVPNVSSADLRTRIDEYLNLARAAYILPGGIAVSAHPQFRYAKAGGVKEAIERVSRIIGKALEKSHPKAIYMAAYGKAKPSDIAAITQALIDAGELPAVRAAHPGVDNEQLVRALQREFKMGIDCSGYVQLAFIHAFTGSDDDPPSVRRRLGLHEKRGWESLANLSSSHFRKVGVVAAQTGDLFVMKPRAGSSDRSWHTVIIVDHTVLGTVHTFLVDASWGTDLYGVAAGGVARRKLKHDSSTGEWWDVNPLTGSDAYKNTTGPYNGHPIHGIFRAKQKK